MEGLGEAAYLEVGMDPEAPHVLRLARALLGPDAVQRGARPIDGPAALIRVYDRWRIVVGRSVPPLAALFAVGHELGHWLLRRAGYDGADEEQAADYLGAALIAPRRAFLRARRAFGDELPDLAEALALTETATALRMGEVERVPLAVVAPARVRTRGPEAWVWPSEPTLRAWARRPARGLRKVRLTDDRARVLLDASALDVPA